MKKTIGLVLALLLSSFTYGEGRVVLSGWASLDGKNIAGYNLYISDVPDRGYRRANQAPVTSTSYTLGGLESGKKYYFVITTLVKGPTGFKESRPSSEFSKVAELVSPVPQPGDKNLFFGFGAPGAKTRWGTDWAVGADDGRCGTVIKIPAKGVSPWDGEALRLAGHLGNSDFGHNCGIVSYVNIAANLRPDGKPVNLAAEGISHSGLRLLLKLGNYHPTGHQDYAVIIRKFSITPDPMKDKGSDYGFAIKGSRLKTDAWTEIKIPFPADGSSVQESAETFSQASWIGRRERHSWDSTDLYNIFFSPLVRNMNFDLMIGGVAFY